MLCEKCSAIHFRSFEKCGIPRKYHASFSERSLYFMHHKSREDLRFSAALGCHFCAAIWDRLFKQSRNHANSTYPGPLNKQVILSRDIMTDWIAESGIDEWNTLDWVRATCEDKSVLSTNFRSFPEPAARILRLLTESANLTEDYKVPYSELVEYRSSIGKDDRPILMPESLQHLESGYYCSWLDNTTISPAAISLAQVWLQNCLNNHKLCSTAMEDAVLPRRVIDITNPESPFLCLGLNRKENYTCLSYKWGESNKYVTTKANYAQHEEHLPVDQLPRTFKDTILVAYALGFRFLWIDALCIVQDDNEDKELEIGVMDRIYQYSTLTIYAAAAENVDDGLGEARDPRVVRPCKLRLTATVGEKTSVVETYVTLDFLNEKEDPLFSRGWVLQEQVLATRGLLFCGGQLKWRCLCTDSSEKDPSYKEKVDRIEDIGTLQWERWLSYPSGLDGLNHCRMWLRETDPLPRRTPYQRENQFNHWYSLVENYSKRSLSFSSDILPALSGMATMMARTHECSYLAGLWEEDIQLGLSWFVSRNNKEEKVCADTPSWSWISKWERGIKFRGWENNHTHISRRGLRLISKSDTGQRSRHQSFTTVQNSCLTVVSQMKPCVLDRKSRYRHEYNDKTMSDACYIKDIVDPTTRGKIGHIAFDSEMNLEETTEIYCLLCTVRNKDEKWQLTCLGLLPTDKGGNRFCRIGLVNIDDTEWFEIGRSDSSTATVQLV